MSEAAQIPPDFEDEQYLTVKEVAAILGLSVWTVNHHRTFGTLKSTRLSRNRVGIRRSELRRWMAVREGDAAAWAASIAEREREKAERYERWLESVRARAVEARP